MSKIAVDVALLVSGKVEDLCIDLNQKALDSFSVLNKKNSFVHITLAMGVLGENDLEKTMGIINKIIKGKLPLDLELIRLDCHDTPDGKKSASFEVKKSSTLVDLHKQILEKLIPFFSFNSEVNMFFSEGNDSINKISTYWVDKYKEKQNHPELFRPHISLKCGQVDFQNFSIKFTVNKLALCQLGNYCSCRKIIKQFK